MNVRGEPTTLPRFVVRAAYASGVVAAVGIAFLAAMFAVGPRAPGPPFGRINDVLVLVSYSLAIPIAFALHAVLRPRAPIRSFLLLLIGLGAIAAIVVLQSLLVFDVLTFEQQIGPVSIALIVIAVWFVLTGYLGNSSGVMRHGVRMGLLAATYVGYPIWAMWIGRTFAQEHPPVITVGAVNAEP